MPFVQPRYAHDKPKARYRTAEAPPWLLPDPPSPTWYQTSTKHKFMASERHITFLCSIQRATRHASMGGYGDTAIHLQLFH